MPKNKGKGGKYFKKTKKDTESLSRDLYIKEGPDQEYATVTEMLGNCRLKAVCHDGVERLCIIRGKLRKKIWVSAGDTILIGLRDYQDNKADVIARYTPEQVRYLKSIGQLIDIKKADIKEIEKDLGNEFKDCGFSFEEI